MLKKGLAWLFAAVLLIGSLAGCSGGNNSSKTDSSKADASKADASQAGDVSQGETLPENLAVLNTEADFPGRDLPNYLDADGRP